MIDIIKHRNKSNSNTKHKSHELFQRVIIVVRGELPTKEDMEEDLQKYLNLNTYLDSEDPWFWQKLR